MAGVRSVTRTIRRVGPQLNPFRGNSPRRRHPGRYGAGYGPDTIDAARALPCPFVTLEAAGGVGLPRDVDRSSDRLATVMTTALADRPAPAR
jgi:hypothetical protein